MSHAAPESPDDVAVKAALSDRAVSVLRTVVPTLWGAVVTALLAWLSPRVDVELAEQLGTWLPAATGAVTAVVISAWYVLWRVLEPRVPAWLVRIVLGSASTPAYSPPASTS